MVRILFWNIDNNDLRNHICEASIATLCDVIVLVESNESSEEILKALQANVSPDFYHPRCTLNRFQLFCRNASLNLQEFYAGKRISLRHLSYAGNSIILGIVHLWDKRNYDIGHQTAQMTLLASEIRDEEISQGHNRTILIGDFNMNPFEQPMNMAEGMNAMMTKSCTEKGSRIVQEFKYDYFYNPMWNLFGDRTPGPSGTYYHPASSNGIFGWNMLDQVLLRPSATQWFEDVEILTKAGDKSLYTDSGRPDKNAASDHFPLLLTLK